MVELDHMITNKKAMNAGQTLIKFIETGSPLYLSKTSKAGKETIGQIGIPSNIVLHRVSDCLKKAIFTIDDKQYSCTIAKEKAPYKPSKGGIWGVVYNSLKQITK